jgi:flagellar biosynthesis protein FlhA
MAELATWLRQRADRLIGVDETQALVDRVAGQRPVLVRETVPKKIDVPSLTALLKVLVADGISLVYLGEVLEILGQLPKHENTQALVEPVRSGLSAVITAGLRGESPVLPVLSLSADTESVLEAALVKLDNGSRLVLPEADAQMIIRKVAEAAKNQSRPVLLTTAHLRQPLARLLASELPAIAVVKPEELTSEVSVEVVGQIDL